MKHGPWTWQWVVGQFLIGLGVPGALCLFFGGAAFLMTVHTGTAAFENARLGAYAGLFLSLLGGAEIVGSLLGGGDKILRQIPLAAGALSAWLLVIFALQFVLE